MGKKKRAKSVAAQTTARAEKSNFNGRDLRRAIEASGVQISVWAELHGMSSAAVSMACMGARRIPMTMAHDIIKKLQEVIPDLQRIAKIDVTRLPTPPPYYTRQQGKTK